MKRSFWMRLLSLSVLVVLVSACAGEQIAAEVQDPAAPVEIEVVSPQAATPKPDSTAAATEAPAGDAVEVSITHQFIPGEPALVGYQLIYDCNTGRRVEAGAAVMVEPTCDTWADSRLERPVHPLRGSYEPALDIIEAQFGYDSGWLYGQIKLFGSAANFTGWYGFELDTDIDGSGEFLLIVENTGQLGDGWTVEGVQVWEDQNGDIGGQTPGEADPNTGDGYETLAFDSGQGLDADLAWARLAPDDTAIVQFAFMPGLVGLPPSFAWWAWSGSSLPDPARFDVVDQNDPQTFQGVDNSCAWGFNAQIEDLPNRCLVIAQPTPTPQPGACPEIPCDEANCFFWDQATCSCVVDYSCYN
ncbi:MAG TPA: hypothetical protein VN376_06490 [Longilinea sp.]|nr:hypothetical protein [Longilinea sp.]